MARRGHRDKKQGQNYRLKSRVVEEFGTKVKFKKPDTELSYSQALFLARGKANPSLETVRLFAQWSVNGNLENLARSLSVSWEDGFEEDERKISSGRIIHAPQFLAILDGSANATERQKKHIWEHLIRDEKPHWENDPDHVSKRTLSKLGVSFISRTKPPKTGQKAGMKTTNTRPARRARTYG